MPAEVHRKANDIGGLAAGSIDRSERELEPWEKSIEASQRCLQAYHDRLLTVDELRRCMEELPPALYMERTQFERWVLALVALLIEKGILMREEIEQRMAEKKRLAHG